MSEKEYEDDLFSTDDIGGDCGAGIGTPLFGDDFNRFFENLTCACVLVRQQIIFNLACDEQFAWRVFGCETHRQRLAAIEKVITAENLIVAQGNVVAEGETEQ